MPRPRIHGVGGLAELLIAADIVNTECPVKGKAVDKTSKSANVEIAFCCDKCKAKFDKAPLAGLIKYAAAADGKCPISGKAVDPAEKSTVAIGVCCKKCKAAVEKEPKKHLAKIK